MPSRPSTKTLTPEEKAQRREERQKVNRERFQRLAPKRTNRALKAIDRVGQMSNTGAYRYTDDEAQKIVAALRSAVDGVEAAFSRQVEGDTEFTL